MLQVNGEQPARVAIRSASLGAERAVLGLLENWGSRADAAIDWTRNLGQDIFHLWGLASSSIKQGVVVVFKLPIIYVELPMSQALREVFFKALIWFSKSLGPWKLSESIKRDRNWSSSCLGHWPPFSPQDPHSSPPITLLPAGQGIQEGNLHAEMETGLEKRHLRTDLVIFFL